MRARFWLALSLSLAACDGSIIGGSGGSGGSGGPGSSGPPGGPPTQPPPQTDDGRYVCDDQIHPAVTEARRLTALEYQNSIAVLFDGRLTPSAQYPGTVGKSVTGFSTEPAFNDIGAGGA